MAKAIFAGSFDPPTYGHLNIIERARKLFDDIDVVIAVNPQKKCLFSDDERLSIMNELVTNCDNVTVHLWSGLIVDYAKQNNANVLIRGVRNVTDFSYEFDLSLMNRTLNNTIETLFIPTEQKYVLLKSSSIKELAAFGADVSSMVPPIVVQKLNEKFHNNKS
ncbi:MAG: pantetheine-phosphate adenylyltransferase [Treponema sp.]|nr:pantetheine-phosphate adenylyltransferase [Treponema sp.]